MWIGLVVIILATLFPPTLITSLKKEHESLGALSFEILKSKGYNDFQQFIRPVFIFSTNTNVTKKKILYGKLFLCHLIASAITGGLIVTFKDKKQKDD